MPRAIWNGAVIADSEKTIKLEGNHYFPPEALNQAHLTANRVTTICPWKGRAHYHDVVVDGQTNPAAAWYYPHPSLAARHIKDYVAFWHGVRIETGTAGTGTRGRRDLGAWLRRLISGSRPDADPAPVAKADSGVGG